METTKLFVIWLDGFLEACGNELNENQTKIIKSKLNDIFHHEAEIVNKPTLEELGQQHGFQVNQGFPNKDQQSDEPGVNYRC